MYLTLDIRSECLVTNSKAFRLNWTEPAVIEKLDVCDIDLLLNVRGIKGFCADICVS